MSDIVLRDNGDGYWVDQLLNLYERTEDNGFVPVKTALPDYEMYDKILPEFMKYMRKELEANYTKGDRIGPKGWLQIKESKPWISDIYYHVGKLQSALMNNDIDRIKENCADVANLAMMVLDVKIDLLKEQTPNDNDDLPF